MGCLVMCDSSAARRRGHAPLLSLDLSQSMMRLSWMLEPNPIMSMYLTTIVIVPLMSMAIIIMLMLVGLKALIILLTLRVHRQNVPFWP